MNPSPHPGSSAEQGGVADRPLQALSDSELLAATLPCASAGGCTRWLLALTLPIAIGFCFDLALALLSLVLGLSICWLLSWWRERSPRLRRARQAETEYEQRFGPPAFERTLAQASALLAQDLEVEAVVCVQGRSLPHGGQHLLRVELARSAATLHVHQAPFLADAWQLPGRAQQIWRESLTLAPANAERVRSSIEAVPPDQTGPGNTFVYDGFPVELVLLRRAVGAQRWQLNLSGVGPGHADHPVVRLVSTVFELARALTAGP
jgi:hypothetical protein